MIPSNTYAQKLAAVSEIVEPLADLHAHSTISDGTLTPQEVLDLAFKRGLKYLAITDHDSVDSLEWSQKYALRKGLTLINGIEFSCVEDSYDDVHILGLWINPQHQMLRQRLAQLCQQRLARNKEIILKLQQLGLQITFQEVEKKAGSAFGRPHIAEVLIEKYPARFKEVQDVFDVYIGKDKPAYVERKDKIKMQEAIDLIHGAGGIASLAHPGVFSDHEIGPLVQYFVQCRGDALETYYPYHINQRNVSVEVSKHKNTLLRALAAQHHLLETGGSDFHGAIRPIMLGDCGLPLHLFNKLLKEHGERKEKYEPEKLF